MKRINTFFHCIIIRARENAKELLATLSIS